MSRYYDRQGREISAFFWGITFVPGKRRIAFTVLPDGKRVSTVWLGLDHGDGDGPPLIFETKVFPSMELERGGLESWAKLDCARYSTEAEALAGHEAMVKQWSERGKDVEA